MKKADSQRGRKETLCRSCKRLRWTQSAVVEKRESTLKRKNNRLKKKVGYDCKIHKMKSGVFGSAQTFLTWQNVSGIALHPQKLCWCTPDGTIDIKHWANIIDMDDPKAYTLKVCPKLTPAHLNPKNYQKMKVSWAFQIFSGSAAVGMEIYAKMQNKLKEMDPSIQFTKRINMLIDILNSGSELTALKEESQHKFLEDFLVYLDDWERLCIADQKSFLTAQTALGLRVMIQSTIESYKFLVSKCGYQYLMTCRIQQDALERFFGMIRSAGGCNTDPNPILFAQTFRLLSAYSLVKPPRSSNIGKGEILKSLLNAKDVNHNEPQPEILENLDAIFDAGYHLDEVDDAGTDLLIDEGLNETPVTTDHVKSYIAGYVVRKMTKIANCVDCIALMIALEPTENRDKMIVLKSRGGLILPSTELFKLISAVEDVITEVLQITALNNNTLFNILSTLQAKHLQSIGCEKCEHTTSLQAVRFYVIMRLHFACRRLNSINNKKKDKFRLLRKQSRLT